MLPFVIFLASERFNNVTECQQVSSYLIIKASNREMSNVDTLEMNVCSFDRRSGEEDSVIINHSVVHQMSPLGDVCEGR